LIDTPRPDQNTDSGGTGNAAKGRTWTLIVACLCVSLVISSMVALNTALGEIAVATSATQSQLTWVVDGYTLVLACMLLPAGAIGDRYGRRGALLIGLLIFTVASVAPAIFDSPLQIILARSVAGAGAAFVMPATLSLLTAAYPKDERAKAVGIWAGIAGSGAVMGMMGSGLLLLLWSWQAIFWAFAAAGLLLFLLSWTISSSRDDNATPLDWPGAVLIGAAVAVFVYGTMEAPTRGWSDPLVCTCIIGGLALAAAFGVVELKRRHPLLDVRLFANPNFATGSAGVATLFFANFGFFYVVMQYIQLVMGYSPIKTALALSPLTLPILTLSALAAWYVPRLGLRLVLSVGLLLVSAGLIALRVLEVNAPYWHLAWPLLILSSGIGFCTAPTTSAIMGAAPDEKQGVASAVNDTTRELGAALGIALAGSILAAQYANVLRPALTAFPAPVRGPASSSLAQALEVSKHLGPQGAPLAELGKSAFLAAMESSMLVLAVLVAVAAVAIGLWSPGRDGQQLRPVRWLTSRHRAGR
jgi:EmrB/QacA subfamily drug resistance transporter